VQIASYSNEVIDRSEHGLLILSPAQRSPRRRLLFVNCPGGRSGWERFKNGFHPTHLFWGAFELVRMGYEIAIPEPLPDFYLYRNPLPHDLKLLKAARRWLRRNDILYCAHNVLYWLPLLKLLGGLSCPIVSLLYAREPLAFSRSHTGIVALTRAAAEHARDIAPHAKIANLAWGMDLQFFSMRAYNPEWFLSCGIANRDFKTLCLAASKTQRPIRVICPGLPAGLSWSSNVAMIDAGQGWQMDKRKRLNHRNLRDEYYPRAAASLIVVKNDPIEYTANGFTNLLEAMALGRPVVMTKTGAVPGEIDVEKEGCGIFVPPEDPDALAEAIDFIGDHPDKAEAMGRKGRELVERYYNIERYAHDLHKFFESL
jgi:glycosyltransferase involved in cell wall biosynthesis